MASCFFFNYSYFFLLFKNISIPKKTQSQSISHCICKRSPAPPTEFMSCSFLRSRRNDVSDRCTPQTRRIPRQSSERTTDKPPRRPAPRRYRRGNLTEPLDGTKPRWDTLSEHAEQSANCRKLRSVIECTRGRFHHPQQKSWKWWTKNPISSKNSNLICRFVCFCFVFKVTMIEEIQPVTLTQDMRW